MAQIVRMVIEPSRWLEQTIFQIFIKPSMAPSASPHGSTDNKPHRTIRQVVHRPGLAWRWRTSDGLWYHNTLGWHRRHCLGSDPPSTYLEIQEIVITISLWHWICLHNGRLDPTPRYHTGWNRQLQRRSGSLYAADYPFVCACVVRICACVCACIWLCACVRVCGVRVCVRACVRARARARVPAYAAHCRCADPNIRLYSPSL